jgi:hypothetical protein
MARGMHGAKRRISRDPRESADQTRSEMAARQPHAPLPSLQHSDARLGSHPESLSGIACRRPCSCSTNPAFSVMHPRDHRRAWIPDGIVHGEVRLRRFARGGLPAIAAETCIALRPRHCRRNGGTQGAPLRGQRFDRLRRPGIPAGLLRLGNASGLRLGVMSDHRQQTGTDGPDSVNRAGCVRIANPE